MAEALAWRRRNAGANASFGDGGNRNFNTNIEGSRNPNLAGIPIDGGFLTTANPDGSFGGASAHNTDFARTIEEAIAFYDSPAFNTGRPVPIELTADEIDNIGRFLRGLNAAIAVKRQADRCRARGRGPFPRYRAHHPARVAAARGGRDQRRALRDLTQVPPSTSNVTTALNATAQSAFASANNYIELARSATYEADRVAAVNSARQLIVQASSSIGTNLTYNIGDGVTMF